MPLRCPLCLTPLSTGTRFLRFCTEHPAPDGSPATALTFSELDERRFLRETRCPRGSCPGNRSVGVPGVFLAHVGCTLGLDPLVDGNGVPLPARDVRAVHPKTGTGEEVGHWQVGLHEAVARRFGDTRPREAFFPALLLRATGEEPEELGARFGALVGLTGSQSVGKTILAMQTLDAQGYPPPGGWARGLGRVAGDYIYCSPEATGSSTPGATYLQTLRMRKLMADNLPFHGWVDATPERPRNVKAAFFLPERAAATKARQKGAVARELGTAWGQVRRILEALAGHAREAPWLHTAIFYDLAGEVSRSGAHERNRQLDAHVDVMTVVFSWEEIAGATPTLGAATSRLREAANWKQARKGAQPDADVRCAVVVTKADLCREATPETFATIAAGPRKDDRTLLLRLLAEQAGARPDATYSELSGLLAPSGPVDDVFFIWTEGIETNLPQSHGLEDFVAWCVLRRRPE